MYGLSTGTKKGAVVERWLSIKNGLKEGRQEKEKGWESRMRGTEGRMEKVTL